MKHYSWLKMMVFVPNFVNNKDDSQLISCWDIRFGSCLHCLNGKKKHLDAGKTRVPYIPNIKYAHVPARRQGCAVAMNTKILRALSHCGDGIYNDYVSRCVTKGRGWDGSLGGFRLMLWGGMKNR